MDTFYQWFQWSLGIAVGLLTAVVAWVGNKLATLTDRIAKAETAVAILENEHHVDPLDYVKAVTEMSTAIATLTATIGELRSEIRNLERVIADQTSQASRSR